MQGLAVARTTWYEQTREHRCFDLGSNASKNNIIRMLFFIHMSLHNNFSDETKANELWRKIENMFQTKNALKRVSVFRKLVKLRYQDGSSMADHLNTF